MLFAESDRSHGNGTAGGVSVQRGFDDLLHFVAVVKVGFDRAAIQDRVDEQAGAYRLLGEDVVGT